MQEGLAIWLCTARALGVPYFVFIYAAASIFALYVDYHYVDWKPTWTWLQLLLSVRSARDLDIWITGYLSATLPVMIRQRLLGGWQEGKRWGWFVFLICWVTGMSLAFAGWSQLEVCVAELKYIL